jgi:hypothetical protein
MSEALRYMSEDTMATPDDSEPVTATDAADSSPPVDDEFDDTDDGDFAPRPRQRFGVLSGVLVVALAIALGFLGGEIVQKHYGTAANAAGAGASAAFAGREGAAGGFGPNGGFGRGTGTGTGTGTSTGTGTGTGTGTSTGTGTGTTPTPTVIGTVTSLKGMTMVVTNLGGTKVTVHLTSTTTVTVSVAKPALKVGQTVSVVGRTAHKIVTATSVTVR